MLETPLHDSHVALGARMIEFAGWDMPVFYSGINEEHLAVRGAAGLFDVSHMGDLVLHGKGCKELLQKLLTNSIEDIPVGKGVYSHILNDEGMIIDDTIVYRTDLEEYLMVPNASKVKEVRQWFRSHDPGDHVKDISDRVACLAVQGPKAIEIVRRVSRVPIDNIKRFHFGLIDAGVPAPEGLLWDGRVMAARTGYTGEDGMETDDRFQTCGLALGTRSSRREWRTDWYRSAWAPGTRCAWRWATCCRAPTSTDARARSRPGRNGW